MGNGSDNTLEKRNSECTSDFTGQVAEHTVIPPRTDCFCSAVLCFCLLHACQLLESGLILALLLGSQVLGHLLTVGSQSLSIGPLDLGEDVFHLLSDVVDVAGDVHLGLTMGWFLGFVETDLWRRTGRGHRAQGIPSVRSHHDPVAHNDRLT